VKGTVLILVFIARDARYAASPVRTGPLLSRVGGTARDSAATSQGVAKLGDVVPVSEPIAAELGMRTTTEDRVPLWSGNFDAPAHKRIRLHLEEVSLPPSTEAWL
jgi:hypothetical protein